MPQHVLIRAVAGPGAATPAPLVAAGSVLLPAPAVRAGAAAAPSAVAVTAGVPAPDLPDAGAANWQHSSGAWIPAGYPTPETTGFAALGYAYEDLTDSAQINYWTPDSGTESSPNVIEGIKTWDHDIRIQTGAEWITFRGCDFSNRGNWAIYLEAGVSNIRFEYCTIHAPTNEDDDVIDSSSPRLQAASWSAGGNGPYTFDHCLFYWVADGPYTIGSDVTFTNNCIHDLTYWSSQFFPPNGDHTNGAGPDGGASSPQTYQHNTFIMVRHTTGQAFDQTSCLNFAQDDPTAYDSLIVDDNVFIGNQGGHVILGYEPGKGGSPGTNIQFTNNLHSVFGTSNPPRAAYHSQPTWNESPANNVWSNNRYYANNSDCTILGTLPPVTT